VKIPMMTRTPRALRPPFPAIRWIVAAALITGSSVGCDVHSPVGPGEIASMTLAPAQTTMGINTTQQLVARAFDADGREISVSTAQWEMVNGGGTVDGQGLFHSGMALGTFSNTVRVSMGGREAFASFTVVAGPAAAVLVTPNPDTLGLGMTRQFTATAVDAGGNPVPVTPTWTIVNGGGAINATSGMFTAGQVMGTFSNTVRATSGGVSGFATVTVTPGPSVSLAVTPINHFMPVNGVQLFTATATDAAGNSSPVTAAWTVVNGGGSINSASGIFTAGATPGAFANTIVATSGGLTASATVTVLAGPVVSIIVTPDPVSMGMGATQQFTARAEDAGGNQVLITPAWSVVNDGGTIDASSGLFTAGDSVGVFSNTVRATSNGISGFATVAVMGASASQITVTPNPVTLGTGSAQQFTATAVDTNGDTISIIPVWTVESGGGTINASSGLFTAGTTTGTFTNTVRATSGTTFGEATVTVAAAPPPDGFFGAAAPNGIMAGTEVTCVTNGVINADVSVHPGTAISGYPPCVITGTRNLGNAVALQAQIDLGLAYDDLAGRACGTSIVADLGGTTLPAGVYCTASGIGVTGTLTLDGGGDPDAVFVFQAGTSLTTAGNIVLIGEAQARNVYWQLGTSATIGTASQWQGNIVALQSITLVDTATLIGRALARNGAVTLGTGNTITLP
jgi:hypothetical protein